MIQRRMFLTSSAMALTALALDSKKLIAGLQQQPSYTIKPLRNDNMMKNARELYFEELPFNKDYTIGKYTAIGSLPENELRTILSVDGPGVITRIWTTNGSEKDVLKIHVFVDGSDKPILSGNAQEIASAAEELSSSTVPWGGFLDGKSVSLYLPIPFHKNIRIEAEVSEPVGGLYWQIDYKLTPQIEDPTWKQINYNDYFKIVSVQKDDENKIRKDKDIKVLKKEFVISHNPVNLILDGPSVIRKISFKSSHLDKIQLKMLFDAEVEEDTTYSPDYQVNVPLKYFISQFNTAGIKRIGNEGVVYFPMPFKKNLLLQMHYIMDEKDWDTSYPITITIEYEKNPDRLDEMYYFNAVTATEVTNGYQDFEVLNIRGEGHFVGVNLFDTYHDHGGGDNIFFDAGTPTAGQLHGICGEDYFHHAYMRIGVSAPYIDSPTHNERARHHIEMPIPFKESFTFNWGCFAGVIPKAVALWYQKDVNNSPSADMKFNITGPFKLSQFENLNPDKLPPTAYVNMPVGFSKRKIQEFERKTWVLNSQNNFVDLCHSSRKYVNTVTPAFGVIDVNTCLVATTKIWVEEATDTEFIIGADDKIKVYLNNELIGKKYDFEKNNPFDQFSIHVQLQKGINSVTLIVANEVNTNWCWNGFSFVLKNDLKEDQMYYLN